VCHGVCCVLMTYTRVCCVRRVASMIVSTGVDQWEVELYDPLTKRAIPKRFCDEVVSLYRRYIKHSHIYLQTAQKTAVEWGGSLTFRA